MGKKIIIGLVGQLAAGKGTVAKYLEESQQAHIYRFSTVLRDILKRLNYEISRQNLQKLSTALRKTLGEDLLARVIASDVNKDNQNIIVVDGIRRWADIKYLQEIPGFILVSIEADPKTRYQRLVKRAENKGDNKKTFEEFLADEKQEADAEVPKIMEKAQEKLDNNGSFKDLYAQIDKLISKYDKQKQG